MIPLLEEQNTTCKAIFIQLHFQGIKLKKLNASMVLLESLNSDIHFFLFFTSKIFLLKKKGGCFRNLTYVTIGFIK